MLTAALERDPESTLVSVDGVGAFDTMSRQAMLQGLLRVPGANQELASVKTAARLRIKHAHKGEALVCFFSRARLFPQWLPRVSWGILRGASGHRMWHDADGTAHLIQQAEGGEQGDPLMPALYSLGQHGALEAVHAQMCGVAMLSSPRQSNGR